MRLVILFTVGLLTMPVVTSAQMVKSKAYNATLRALLSHNVAEVGVAEAAKQHNAIFLDSRSRREYDVSHIPSAIWIGYDEFNSDKLAGVKKNSKIIIYCSVGYRSEKITQKLSALGYTNVQNLYGGIFEWVNQGLSVIDANGATNNIHAYSRAWGIWLTKGNKVYK